MRVGQRRDVQCERYYIQYTCQATESGLECRTHAPTCSEQPDYCKPLTCNPATGQGESEPNESGQVLCGGVGQEIPCCVDQECRTPIDCDRFGIASRGSASRSGSTNSDPFGGFRLTPVRQTAYRPRSMTFVRGRAVWAFL